MFTPCTIPCDIIGFLLKLAGGETSHGRSNKTSSRWICFSFITPVPSSSVRQCSIVSIPDVIMSPAIRLSIFLPSNSFVKAFRKSVSETIPIISPASVITTTPRMFFSESNFAASVTPMSTGIMITPSVITSLIRVFFNSGLWVLDASSFCSYFSNLE